MDKRKPLPPRPPKKQKKIKKILKEAEARAQGEILGQYKAHAKKPWQESLKEHLGHWIDNIDPLELAAVGALTVVVHEAVLLLDDGTKGRILRWEISSMIAGPVFGTLAELTWFGGTPQIPGGHFERTGVTTATPQGTLTWIADVVKPGVPVKQQDVWQYWVMSFAVAYLLVKYGGQLIGLLGSEAGAVSKIVGLMLA